MASSTGTGKFSPDNSTKDYFNNLTKVQLQRPCRSTGLTNVWANKGQLVDMIIEQPIDGATSPTNSSSPSARNCDACLTSANNESDGNV